VSAPTELRCYNCGVSPSTREMLDGWCDECGKRLPDSFASEAKKRLAAQPAPSAPRSRRGPWVGFALAVLLGAGALVVVLAS
jgi:hypothetical protein